MDKKTEDYYKLLNLSKNATPDEISRAFRHKSREYHPDKNINCEDIMVQLTRAKITLLNLEKRAKYDDEYEGSDVLSEEEKIFLFSGIRMSERLKKKLSQWEKEFKSIQIEDNFDSLSVKPGIIRSADSVHGITTNIYRLVNNMRDLKLDPLDEDAQEIKEKPELVSLCEKRLNELIYDDNLRELALFVKQNRSNKAIDRLHEAYTKGRNIEEYPNKFKAVLKLLQGSSLKMSGKYNDSLKCFQEALLLCPSEDMCSAISLLLDSNYMESVAHNFLKNLDTVHNIPEQHEHVDKLKGNPDIRMTTRYEKSVLKNKQLNYFEKAMLYVDLSMAALNCTVFANNYLIAATFLFHELRTNCFLARKCALRNLIFKLIETVIFVAKRFEQPVTMLYFMKFSYILMRKCHVFLREALKNRPSKRLKRKTPLISEHHKEMLVAVEKEMIHLVKVTPFTDFRLTLSADLIYLDVVHLQFLQNYYPERIKDLKDHPWAHLYHYYQFELYLKTGDEEDILQTYRKNLMKALLDRKGWKQNKVEGLMGWEMINRDDNGWWDVNRPWLNIEGDNYSRVAGVDVDVESGSIRLLLCKCPDGSAGLFGMDDVAHVLWNGVGSSFFTLDQADVELSSHPFQEMKYAPHHLKHTDFLATLLHADYLLKMFSIGTEVSVKSPFLFRDSSEGLKQKLPEHLREALKPVHQRKDGQKYGNVHRFWIESKELGYYVEEIEDGVLRFTFDEVRMVVKKHLMKYNSEGVLVDDEDDEDTEDEDEDDEDGDVKKQKKGTSPEKQFAKDFTEHYEEIGLHHPVLLRLRELLKLGAVSTILRSLFKNKQEAIKKLQTDKKSITDQLREIRRQVEYPVNTDSKVNEIYRKCLQEQGISANNVAATAEWQAKRDIREQLEKADQKNLETVAKSLKEGLDISEYVDLSYNATVKGWLTAPSNWFGYGEGQLSDYLANALIQKLSRFGNTLKSMGFNLDADEEFKLNDGKDCVWVPSAFRREDRIRVYGGVNLQLNMINRNGGTSGGGSRSGSGSGPTNVNKNSLRYTGPSHLYLVRRVSDGKAAYVGISSQGYLENKVQGYLKKMDPKYREDKALPTWLSGEFNVIKREPVDFSLSKRGQVTANKLTKSTGELHVAQVVHEFDNRRPALVWERRYLVRARERCGPDTFPLNRRMADAEFLRKTAKPKQEK